MKIATRKSPLAIAQTTEVQQKLASLYTDLTFEMVLLSTQGDQIQDRSLAELGGKGLFIKALEESLVEGQADIAVHSLKDVPPLLDSPFMIGATLPRSSPRDTLISKQGCLHQLRPGATIGTSSVRRKAELLHYRSDFNIVMLRGNVETRLRKLDEGYYDAIILAEAGLMRLHLTHRITEVLSPEFFLPSVGQGIIAIEILKARPDLMRLLAALNDAETFACATAERAMNQYLGASCTSPVGSHATLENNLITLHGAVFSQNGRIKISTVQTGLANEALAIGQRAAEDLKHQGALILL